MSQLRSKIIGVGSYLPPRKVSNDDLKQYMDTTDEWIQQRTGIQSRHWVDDGTSTSDLGLEAAKNALKSAGLEPSDVDLLIFGTLSPDHDFPGTGCFLQEKLDLPAGVPVLDIRQQCSAWVYAVNIADAMIRAGQYKTILFVGAEVHSRALDLSTEGRTVSVLFGDAGAAAVFQATEINDASKESHVLGSEVHADGRHAKELWIAAPGSAFPGHSRIDHELLDQGAHYPYMNGKLVFTNASKRMPECLRSLMTRTKTQSEDVDLFVFHQANLRINEMVAKQLKVAPEKVFNTIQRFGNTTAASIPLGLDTAVKENRLERGMLVASAAFGAGFTWGASLIRW